METKYMEKSIISFDGIKIYYIYKKNIKPSTLIFLHGIAADWSIWRNEIDFFDKKGYSILAPDLRGHGLSERPIEDEKYNFVNFVRDINELIKKENIKKFTLVGHSVGGAIAITYCELFKKLPKSLVLVDTAHRYPYVKNRELNRSPYINYILRFLSKHSEVRKLHFPHLLEHREEIKNFGKRHFILFNLFHHTPLKCIFKCLDTIHEHSKKYGWTIEKILHSLNIPVLILAAKMDKTIPPRFSENLHHVIKTSQLEIIKDAHHWAPIEKPEEINKSMIEFFKRYNL